MFISFTTTQKERLIELSADEEIFEMKFENDKERNDFFAAAEIEYVRMNKNRINDLLNKKHIPDTLIIQDALGKWLMEEESYTQVITPTIIRSSALDKMTITSNHDLSKQVFWLDSKKCLRPMLAPNLYVVMKELRRISKKPVKIFEAGSCFRKESQGAQHMNEFTMLNFVELASVENGKQMERLEHMARSAMKAVNIDNYELEKEASTVYGESLDVVVDGIEVASGSFGPHFLDSNWGVFDTWVGMGFGIERLALVKNNYKTIKRIGKSITFIDGVPLNI